MAIEGAAAETFDAGLSDVILPAQYFGTMGSTGFSSEQRLRLAVLVDAINILQGGRRFGRRRQALAEAAHWVNMRRMHDPFSFDRICDALNVDSEILRRRLSGLTMGYANAAKLGYLRVRKSGRANR